MQSVTGSSDALPPSVGGRRQYAAAIWWASSLACAALLSRRQLADYDLPWNLATGRILIQSWQIPRIDDLAFTARPLRYVEVIGDALLYVIYASTGPLGLQVMCAGIGVLTVALLVSRAAGVGPLRWLWGALGLFASSEWFIMRPVMFSYVGIILTLIVLDAHRRAPDRKFARRVLCGLVPLFFVWANIHGFVASGTFLAVAYALYRATARLLGERHPSPLWPLTDGGDLLATFGIVAAAIAAASTNTMGPRLLLGPLRSEEQFQVTEWAAPTLTYFVEHQPWLSLWFLFSLGLWLCGRHPLTQSRIPTAFSVGQAFIACALVASAVRLLPFGAFVMAHAATTRMSQPLSLRPIGRIACSVSPLLAALALLLQLPLSRPPGFDPTHLPVAATEFAASVRPAGRMYNSMPYGGYLALRLWPEHRVFTDGRDALAREQELVNAIARAAHRREAFEALDQRFGFEWALISAREAETFDPGLAASARWAMIYLDDISAIYVRADGPNAALARRGYRALRHLIDPASVLAEASGDRPAVARALAHDGALALAQAPDSPRAAFLAAAGGLAAQDAEAFEVGYQRLAWLVPGHPALSILADARRRLQLRATLP